MVPGGVPERGGSKGAKGWEESIEGGAPGRAKVGAQGKGHSPSFSAMSQPLVNDSPADLLGRGGTCGERTGEAGPGGAQPSPSAPSPRHPSRRLEGLGPGQSTLRSWTQIGLGSRMGSVSAQQLGGHLDLQG